MADICSFPIFKLDVLFKGDGFNLFAPYIVKNGVILGRLSVNETLKIREETVVNPYTLMVIYGKEKR